MHSRIRHIHIIGFDFFNIIHILYIHFVSMINAFHRSDECMKKIKPKNTCQCGILMDSVVVMCVCDLIGMEFIFER